MILMKKVNLGGESEFLMTLNSSINIPYLKRCFYDKCHKSLKYNNFTTLLKVLFDF